MNPGIRPSTTLTVRFILLMTSVIIIGVGLTAGLSGYQNNLMAREDAGQAAVDRAITVLDALESAATDESLSRFIFATAAQPMIHRIALLDADGVVVMSSRRAWQRQPAAELTDSGLIDWFDEPVEPHRPEAHWNAETTRAVALAHIRPVNPAADGVDRLSGGKLFLSVDGEPFLASARQSARFDTLVAAGILLAVMGLFATILQRRVVSPLETLYRRASGAFEDRKDTQPIAKETPQELQTLSRAIDELSDTRLALAKQQERLAGIANTIPGTVYEYRHYDDADDPFTFASAGIISLLGGPEGLSDEARLAFVNETLWSIIVPEDLTIIRQATEIANQGPAQDWQAEFRIDNGAGVRWIWGHASPVDDPLPGQLFRGVLLDSTRRRALEERLERAATHDPLTDALNRGGIAPQLESSVADAQRQGVSLSVFLMDIDHFKTVNDNLGHAVGDAVLRALVSLVQTRLRRADSLSRWGGEEFLALLPHTGRAGATEIAESVRNAIASASFDHGQPIHVSLGVATLRSGDTVDKLVQRADERLYAAKARGRNCVVAASDHAE